MSATSPLAQMLPNPGSRGRFAPPRCAGQSVKWRPAIGRADAFVRADPLNSNVSVTVNTDPLDTSRRGFLQRFAGTMAIGAGTSLQAVAVTGNLYVNHRVGLAICKPERWRHEHLRTFANIRNEYEYATPDPELAQQLRSGPLPLVVVSQDSVLRTLAASVTVYAEDSPLSPGESLAEAANDLVRGVSMFVKDFKLLGTPRFGPLARNESMDYSFSFFYEDRLGNRGPARHRTVVVLRPPHIFTFNMLDIPADRIDAQAEFTTLRDSIALA